MRRFETIYIKNDIASSVPRLETPNDELHGCSVDCLGNS